MPLVQAYGNFWPWLYDAFGLLSYFKLFNINSARTIGVEQIEGLSDLLLLFLAQLLFGNCFLPLNCGSTGFPEAGCLKIRKGYNFLNKNGRVT